jgi:signal peptidase I
LRYSLAVPNYLPGTDPSEVGTAAKLVPQAPSFQGRLFAAAILSSIVPGAGQFLIFRWRKGAFFFLGFAILVFLYWWLRLPKTIYGLVLPILAVIGLCVFSAWDAAYKGKTPRIKPSQWWLAALIPIAFIAGVLHSRWLVPASGFQGFSIPASSMAPAIPLGSHVVVDRWYYRHTMPRRGDIVVARAPSDPGIYIAKRVIAVGGDRIEIRGDTVLLNDAPISEPYARLEGSVPDVEERVRPITLPAGKLFVMGDNRHVSFDSRAKQFGLVDVSSVRGKVIYLIPDGKNNLKNFH